MLPSDPPGPGGFPSQDEARLGGSWRTTPLLEFRDLRKHFAAVQVLRGVNMTVRAAR